jgi:type IV secretory pathway TrbD component
MSARDDGHPANETPSNPLVVPVRKTMLEKFLLLGIDRKWCLGQLAIVGVVAAGLRNPYALGGVVISHLVLWLMVRKDPDQVSCYLKYGKQGDFYEPRQSPYQRRNARPQGFGRGVPL